MELKMEVLEMPKIDEIQHGRILSRDEVLTMLSDNIQDLNHKIKYGKIRDKTNAKIKNAQVNSFVYLAQNYLKGLKDRQLDEIQKELVELRSGNVSMDDFHQSVVENTGIDMDEIQRIETIIESFEV